MHRRAAMWRAAWPVCRWQRSSWKVLSSTLCRLCSHRESPPLTAHRVLGNPAHGRQAARTHDFTSLNLADLCEVLPYAHELACTGELSATGLPNEGSRYTTSPSNACCARSWTPTPTPRAPDR